MEVLITIVEFLAVLTVVVLVHEFGHFATAKAFGIRVNEFGWGFPPRLVRVFRKGETDYTINLIPIGGFVKLEGENDPTQPRSLASKGVGTRFIVLVAGVFMNVVLAIFLFTVFFTFTVPIETLRVGGVTPGSPAALSGVLPEDVILEVNGDRIRNYDELLNSINRNRGEEVEWLVQRGDTQQRVSLIPRANPPQGQGATGISVVAEVGGVQTQWYARHPWDAAARGIKVTWSVPGALKDAIVDWVANDGPTPFAGPVGIAQGTGEWAREFGLVSLIPLAALLSISLAILNIMPIPALDGGRLMFVILEWVRRGKRISPEKEGLVHLIGFVVMIVMVLGPLTYKDIARLVEGGSLLR